MKKLLLALFCINFLFVTTCQATPDDSYGVPEEDFFIELDDRAWKLATVMEGDSSSDKSPTLIHLFCPADEDEIISEIFTFTCLGVTDLSLEGLVDEFTNGLPESGIDNLQFVHIDDTNLVFTFSFVCDDEFIHAIGHIYKIGEQSFFGYYMDLQCDDIYELEDHWTPVLLESADYFYSLITE